MNNITFVCAPGYRTSRSADAYPMGDANRLMVTVRSEAPTVMPTHRERWAVAAALTVVKPIRVQTQTADLPYDLSALTRERRT